MVNWINKKRNKKGFTLIELVVVIAILGILAAIAIPRLNGSREKAAITADEASIRTIQSAISIAEADGEINLLGTTAPTAAALLAAVVPEFLAEVPETQQTGMGGWQFTITAGGSATEASTIVITPIATVTTGWTNAGAAVN